MLIKAIFATRLGCLPKPHRQVSAETENWVGHWARALLQYMSLQHKEMLPFSKCEKRKIEKKPCPLNGCPLLSGNFISDEACKNSSTMWWAFFVLSKRTFLTSEWTRTQLDSVNFNPLKRPFTRYLLRSKHPLLYCKNKAMAVLSTVITKKLIVTIWNVVLWN